jgi:RND family efflux transporter MFP subunit
VANAKLELTQAQGALSEAQSGLSQVQSGKSQLESALESTKSQKETLKDNLKTTEKTYEITKNEVYPQTDATYSAQLAQANVGLESARYQLDMYTVKAPISGQIESISVEKDSMASAGSPAYVISNKDSMTVTFNVAEKAKDELQVGDAIEVERNGETFAGTITEVGTMAGQQTRLFQVKASVIGSGDKLPSGVSVKVHATTQREESSLVIPYDAIYFSAGSAYVYCVEDGKLVKLDEEAMNQYGLTMSSIAQYIATTDFTVPIGSLEQGTQSISAISTADVTTVEDLREIPLFTATGSMIHLSDVADVEWSQKDPDSISRYNGEETLTVSVTKNQSASTLGVVRDVRKTMERLQKEHPGLVATASYDASDMILLAVKSVGSTLLMGVILSMLVLFIFFGDGKASLIVGSAMPISLLVTVIVMAVAGFSLNIITLGALVIAIGMMVDSSSVVLESCFRAKDKKPGFREAAEIGTRGVAGSIVASTITTVVVYLPLCIQTGLTGQIFGQLGYTIIIAMLASLISALTLVPLFFCIFKPQEKKELKLNGFLDKVKEKYDRLERKLLHKKKLSVLVAVVLLVMSFGLVSLMKVELMPAMDEGTISVAAAFRSGTKAEEVDKKMQEIEAMVAAHEDVDSYTLTSSKGSGKISVNLKENRKMSSQEVADEWLEETKDMTGVQLDITVSSQMSTMMLTSSGGSVTLASTNLDDLKEAVSALQEKAWNIPGVLNVSSDAGEGATQIRVVIDPLDAMAHGMTPIQAAGGLYSMISGTEAMTITSNGEEYSVMLEYPEGTYTKASSLLDASVGGVPLSEMATLQYTDSQQTVMKQNGKYTTTITASCVSEDTDAVDAALDKLVADTKLPDSVEQTKDTMDEMMTETFTAIGKAIAAAVFLVFLVMAMQFESPKYSLMVMLSIPFSLIGSFGLLFLSGHSRFVYIISRHSPGRTAISRHHLKITILHRVPADLPGTAAGRHPVQTDLIVGSSHLQAQIFNWCGR